MKNTGIPLKNHTTVTVLTFKIHKGYIVHRWHEPDQAPCIAVRNWCKNAKPAPLAPIPSIAQTPADNLETVTDYLYLEMHLSLYMDDPYMDGLFHLKIWADWKLILNSGVGVTKFLNSGGRVVVNLLLSPTIVPHFDGIYNLGKRNAKNSEFEDIWG